MQLKTPRRDVLEHPNLKTSDKNVLGSNSADLLALKWRYLQTDKTQINSSCKDVQQEKNNNIVESLL